VPCKQHGSQSSTDASTRDSSHPAARRWNATSPNLPDQCEHDWPAELTEDALCWRACGTAYGEWSVLNRLPHEPRWR
jgi:hypothetical protein